MLLAGGKPDPRDLAEYTNSLELDKAPKPILDARRVLDPSSVDLKTNFLSDPRLLRLTVLGDGANRPKVWTLIHKLAAQYNVQVFAVTHSHKCPVASHEAAKEFGYDCQYRRIEKRMASAAPPPF